MRSYFITLFALVLLGGCVETPPAPPAVPVDPIPAGAVLPPGMPNDNWFYENVVKSDVPVLVDFNATWCGPCKAMKPALEEIKKAYGNRLKIVEIDIDERTFLADHFQANRIPRLLVIKDGVVEGDVEGMRTYYEIVSLLKPTVGRP